MIEFVRTHIFRLIPLCAVLLLVACGGDDDDDDDEDTRPVLEIHLNETSDSGTSYTAIASASGQLSPINGSYYRGAMNSSDLNDSLILEYTDGGGAPLADTTLRIELIDGDGTLSDTTLTTNDSGLAALEYTFSGDLGHAVIRVKVPGTTDSVQVLLRANTILPEPMGQGQYIRLTDTWGLARQFNITPEFVDPDPRNIPLLYVGYETAEHVVLIVEDSPFDSTLVNSEQVLGVILTAGYTAKLPSGIGLGSTYDQMIAALGAPDSVGYDGTAPATDIYFYFDEGLNFFVQAASTSGHIAPTASTGLSSDVTRYREYREFIRR